MLPSRPAQTAFVVALNLFALAVLATGFTLMLHEPSKSPAMLFASAGLVIATLICMRFSPPVWVANLIIIANAILAIFYGATFVVAAVVDQLPSLAGHAFWLFMAAAHIVNTLWLARLGPNKLFQAEAASRLGLIQALGGV